MFHRVRLLFCLLCIIILTLSYSSIDQDSLYPIEPEPGDSLEPGISFGLFKKAAVQIENQLYTAYELTLSAQAPILDANMTSLSAPLLSLKDKKEDMYACNPIADHTLDNKIALIRRGNCSLLDKIRHCEQAGAVAVIISGDSYYANVDAQNDEAEELLASQSDSLFGVGIPGLIVSGADYRYFLSLEGEEASVWSLPAPETINLMQLVVLLFFRPLVMLTIILIFVSMNLRNRTAARKSSSEVVKALHVRPWDNVVNIFDQTQCNICFEDFEPNVDVMTLPCKHEFHRACVSEWLLKERGMCPLCKLEVDEESVGLEP